MAPRISLALAFHNHQPVGNFGWVFDEVFEQAYEPMVAALERHPTVRLSLHYTGPLLEWLRAERPEFIERLAALVARDQVEILGGGYYEPVLASLPERDRVGQLRRMGVGARGAVRSAAARRVAGGARLGAGPADLARRRPATTGRSSTTPISARRRSPRRSTGARTRPTTRASSSASSGPSRACATGSRSATVDEVIDYLRDHATEDGERIGMMGDDGEKFGAWPTTWEHCWGKRRWVDRFFEALEANADWLTTTTPSDWLADHLPIGRVYIPTGSYEEMGEWALPADESLVFHALLKEAKEESLPEARWLRGAFWRNFQVKYREINDLHKQMLRTSDAVDAMPDGPERARALDHLYHGQSNDCYWHGLFGGVYIGHMRLATYHHLIAAEDLADTAAGHGSTATEIVDLDLDGQDDVRLAGPGQVVTIDLTEGAGIGGWDIRPVRHALAAVMRRRPEAYHQTLRDHEAALAAARRRRRAADGGRRSMRRRRSTTSSWPRRPDLADRLHYDPYERRSGLVRFLAPGTTPRTGRPAGPSSSATRSTARTS